MHWYQQNPRWRFGLVRALIHCSRNKWHSIPNKPVTHHVGFSAPRAFCMDRYNSAVPLTIMLA